MLALFPASAQIGGVKLFTNGLDTTTSGQDLVAAYQEEGSAQDIGQFSTSASASATTRPIKRAIRSTPQLRP